MEWFPRTFPSLVRAASHFITGYEACDMIREFLHENGWGHLSALEVLLAQGCPGVARALGFLSHSQAEMALKTTGNVTFANNMHGIDLWFVDFTSIRQCVKGDFQPAAVRGVIAKLGCTALLLEPIEAPITLTRLWCVFEIAMTVETGAALHCLPGDHSDAAKNKPHCQLQCMRSIEVRLQHCDAREEQDKIDILRGIESSKGLDATNAIVTQAIHTSSNVVEDKWKEWGIETTSSASCCTVA